MPSPRPLALLAALPLAAAVVLPLGAPAQALSPAPSAVGTISSSQALDLTLTPSGVGRLRVVWTGVSPQGYQVSWRGGSPVNGVVPSATFTTYKQDITLSSLSSGTYTVTVKNLSTGRAVTRLAPLTAAGYIPAPRTPVSLKALPSLLDVKPVYSGQTSCDPTPREGTKALANLLTSTYKRGYPGMERLCAIGEQSEHHDGRAIDWMLDINNPYDYAAASSFTRWASANDGAMARRLGIQYIIWNKTMWRAYAPERGWTPYTGASPHTDHVHISLTWDGATKATSWWTGTPVVKQDLGPCKATTTSTFANLYTSKRVNPCPTPVAGPKVSLPTVKVGDRGATVKKAQAALGIKADGVFGWGTRASVVIYQKAWGLPVTGAVDAPTWAKLVPSSRLS